MKKKGFVLMETVTVVLVISVALLAIFSSYNKILNKLRAENKYDTTDYIYRTHFVRKLLKEKSFSNGTYSFKDATNTTKPTDLLTYVSSIKDVFNIKKIYLLKNVNSLTKEKLKNFDGYMIDYIRKLDVNDNDVILVVEYKGPTIKDKMNNEISETFIASLKWE